jgi:hypothetical protein
MEGAEAVLQNKKITPAYLAFYILFSPDAWRILAGILLAVMLAPGIAPPDLKPAGSAMLHVMIACIGYVVMAKPATWTTRWLKSLFLGKNRP